MFQTVHKIKIITTIMDVVGMILIILSTAAAVVLLFGTSGILEKSKNFLENHVFNELTGGYEVLGGTLAFGGALFGVMASFIFLAIAVLLLIAFLVPSIHGLLLWKKTRVYLAADPKVYREVAMRDSIIKLIFNGIPIVLLLKQLFNAWNMMGIGLIVYFAVVCALEIAALFSLEK